ncbi:MAG: hypothetical protein J6O18_05100 [Bacilli bacterium]|nr:hypothetical protein [Bacilli bacterium]
MEKAKTGRNISPPTAKYPRSYLAQTYPINPMTIAATIAMMIANILLPLSSLPPDSLYDEHKIILDPVLKHFLLDSDSISLNVEVVDSKNNDARNSKRPRNINIKLWSHF